MSDKPNLEHELREGMAAYETWKGTPPPEAPGQLCLFTGKPIIPAPDRIKRETKNQLKLWE